MDINKTIENAKNKLKDAENHFAQEIKKLRTGRAHPSMLDNITVKAYGTDMPLNQVANVTAPEAQLLQITPFDITNIGAINDAIRNNPSLDMNPMDDGRVVRVPVPALTTERRQQIVKQLNEKVEEAMIVTRNIRHEVLTQAKQAKTDKMIGENDYIRIDKQIEDLMLSTKQAIDGLAHTKEQEIMTV